MSATGNGIDAMWNELVEMCNAQFASAQFARLLGMKFSKARA
jgi:hypothetical protein